MKKYIIALSILFLSCNGNKQKEKPIAIKGTDAGIVKDSYGKVVYPVTTLQEVFDSTYKRDTGNFVPLVIDFSKLRDGSYHGKDIKFKADNYAGTIVQLGNHDPGFTKVEVENNSFRFYCNQCKRYHHYSQGYHDNGDYFMLSDGGGSSFCDSCMPYTIHTGSSVRIKKDTVPYDVPITFKQIGPEELWRYMYGSSDTTLNMSIYFTDSLSNRLVLFNNGHLVINGDTVRVIKSFMKFASDQYFNKKVILIQSNGDTLKYQAGDTIRVTNCKK